MAKVAQGKGNQVAVMLPVYEVQWRGSLVRANRKRPEAPIVTMIVSGATKQLLEYHLLDDSLMLAPAIHIKDSEKLLLIKDDEFQKFDEPQRNNLVAQFNGASSAPPSNPAAVPALPSIKNRN